MKRFTLLTGFVFFTMLGGCGKDFIDTEIIKVGDVSIMESEFLEELDFQLSFRDLVITREEDTIPGKITEEELKKQILEEMLIPLAAVKAKYKDKIEKIMEEAETIRDLISEDGSNFRELAIKYSKDTNAKNGGELGTLTRMSQKYPIPRYCFKAKKGEIVGPFLSQYGCHIFKIKAVTKGTIPSADAIRAAHILLPYEPTRPDFVVNMLPQIVKDAKIQVMDPSYEAFVTKK